MASTALLIEACAVMTTILVQDESDSRTGINSMPSCSPSLRSTKARSKDRLRASSTASTGLLTAMTVCPSAARQYERVLRMLASSSMPRTLRWLNFLSLFDDISAILQIFQVRTYSYMHVHSLLFTRIADYYLMPYA